MKAKSSEINFAARNQPVFITAIRSVSQGTDLPSSKQQPSNFLCPPQALKILTGPPRQTKISDNTNTCLTSLLPTCLTITLILISKQPTNTTAVTAFEHQKFGAQMRLFLACLYFQKQ